MNKRVTCSALALMAAAISCLAQVPSQLAGEWRFADIQSASNPVDAITPPMFDVLVFMPPNSVILRDTLRHREFRGRYVTTPETITWTFQPKDAPSAIEHAVHYSLPGSNSLVLRAAAAKDSYEQQVDWVFLKPERFLPNDPLVGNWAATVKGETIHRVFHADGSLEPSVGKKGEAWGIYRLWRSAEDQLQLTTLLWVQGEGAFATFEQISVEGKALTSISRVPPGFEAAQAELWHRTSATTSQKSLKKIPKP